jgi:amino acid transporter
MSSEPVAVLDKPLQVKRPLWRSIVAVAWSFIGIRKNSEFQEDLTHITPLHILGVGLVAGLLFVIGLIVLVNLVVAK